MRLVLQSAQGGPWQSGSMPRLASVEIGRPRSRDGHHQAKVNGRWPPKPCDRTAFELRPIRAGNVTIPGTP